MNSNKDMQNMQDLFDFHMGQRLQASQEACSKLIREMRAPGVLSGDPNSLLPAWTYDPNTAYCRGYQNGYLDGFNKGMEHAANRIKNLADSEEVKDEFE